MSKSELERCISFSQQVIASGRTATRNFDNCFEWHGSHAVAIALYRKTQKRPDTKLAQNLFKYLSEDPVKSSVDTYGHWEDLEALCEHLKSSQ
jgi:hypothetical protein